MLFRFAVRSTARSEDPTRRPSGRHLVGRLTLVVLGLLLSGALGLAAATAAATTSDRPAVALAAGLGTVAALGALIGARVAAGPARGRRLQIVAVVALASTAAAAAAVLIPLRDPRPAYPADLQPSYWSLATGSRLAYVKVPASGRRQPVPVVVLHGGPGMPDMAGDRAFWGQLGALGYDVYVYDQLGTGRSSRLTDPTGYGIDRDVADLEQIRRIIRADRLILVGYSYGGGVAAHYLAARSRHVEKLVLVSPLSPDPADTSGARANAGLDPPTRIRVYAKTLQPRALLGYLLLQVNPDAAHAFLGDVEADARSDTILTLARPALSCPAAAPRGAERARGSGFYAWQYPQSRRSPRPADPRRALAGLSTPVLVVKGGCDYLSWTSAAQYRQLLPNATLLYLPEAGHHVHGDRPAEVLAATRAFLGGGPMPWAPRTDLTRPAGYHGPA